jgi:hypothetical protein
MSYFKLGEEIIIEGKLFTEFNGMEATVTYVSPSPVELISGYFGYSYKTSLDTNPFLYWHETSLRKKHKPSTESLSSMIAKLNIKSKVAGK